MKSEITKEWFLILLVSVLAVYTYDAFKSSVLFFFQTPDIKHPLFHWLYRVIKIVLLPTVWYMLLIHHAKLLLTVKSFLWFMMLTSALPYLYFTCKFYYKGDYYDGLGALFRFVFYITISVSLYLFSKKYITINNDNSKLVPDE